MSNAIFHLYQISFTDEKGSKICDENNDENFKILSNLSVSQGFL